MLLLDVFLGKKALYQKLNIICVVKGFRNKKGIVDLKLY